MMESQCCPNCNEWMLVDTHRWDARFVCPNCGSKIYFDFDFIWDEESGEEWDCPELKIVNDEEFDKMRHTELLMAVKS